MEMYTQILIKIFFIGVTALIIKLFFDISLMWAIIFVFIINFILLAGKNIILWKESLRRFFDNMNAQKRYFDTIKKYRKEIGSYVSPIIKLDADRFRVVEYFQGFTPAAKPQGYIIIPLDKDTNKFTKQTALNVRNLYLMWYDAYFNPIMGKSPKGNRTTFKDIILSDKTKELILGNLKMFKNIRKFEDFAYVSSSIRRRRGYSKIEKRKGEEYTSLLKDLDKLTILQHDKVKEIMDIEIKWIEKSYDLFKFPSDLLFDQLIRDTQRIKDLVEEQNNDFDKRIRLWGKIKILEKGRKSLINRLNVFPFILISVIDFLEYAIRGTIYFANTITFLSIAFLNGVLYLNKFFIIDVGLFQILGVKGINKIKLMKKGINEARNRYIFISQQTNIGNIRNYGY